MLVMNATLVQTTAPAPHLFVALVDDLGYSNVGFHNPQQRSPEIDHLAQVLVLSYEAVAMSNPEHLTAHGTP